MRRKKYAFFLLGLLTLWPEPSAYACRPNRPRTSPNAAVSQTIAVTEITLHYGRPGVKKRKIWGELVPYDKVWRTGANEATTISFSQDVLIEGQKLLAGTYALFTIPGKNAWTIIFNKNSNQWGTDDYHPDEDVLRISAKPRPAPHEEWMSFSFTDLSLTSATVLLRWEKLAIPFQIQVAQ